MKAPLLKAMLHFITLRRSCFHIAGSKWHNKAKRNVRLIHDALAAEVMNHSCLQNNGISIVMTIHHIALFGVKLLFSLFVLISVLLYGSF